MPLISIVIAVYNNEKYIKNSIDSVQKQQFEDYEIVIIDDGSTDKTAEIVDNEAKKDDRIRVIHQENQWIYASFNNGVKAARGEYVYILNSDDKLMSYALNLLNEKIIEYNHPDVIYTKILKEEVDEEQRIIRVQEFSNINKEVFINNKEEVLKNWILIDQQVLCDQANLYKRELMLNHPFTNEYFCGDNYFNVEIMEDINNFVILPQIMYEHCVYNNPNFNASKGKYYDYTHQAYNKLFSLKKQYLLRNNLLDEVNNRYIVRQRLSLLTVELNMMTYDDCKLNINDKINIFLNEYVDNEIRNEARECGWEREFESRLLNGINNVIKSTPGEIDAKYDFIKDLVRFLPNYHLDNVSIPKSEQSIIDNAINNIQNKNKLGDIYYHTQW